MSLIHRTFLLGLLSVSVLGSVVDGQQRSREEILKEAARLAGDADRMRGETIKKVQAGADRHLIPESEKVAAESFEKAVELWREAGDDKRLIAGVDELTRIYSVLGDYDRVVDRLTREVEYWRNRGNVAAQTDTLYLLGIRQLQMKRDPAAI